MTIESKQLHLIRQVLQINYETFIDELITLVKNKTPLPIATAIQPNFDLEAIKQKQGYQPFNRAEFDQLVKELDIQEPLEDLLAMLTK